MAKLICSAITSLDGYVADAKGGFDWAAPDDEVHAFVNELERPIGTYLYGRRMYEVMAGWETLEDPRPVVQDFAAMWRAAEKIVFSTSLHGVKTSRTTLERAFDPRLVRSLKQTSRADLSVGGAQLAGQALRAGLVDECSVLLVPVLVGGGTRFLPEGVRGSLVLTAARRFRSGMVYLRYRVGA